MGSTGIVQWARDLRDPPLLREMREHREWIRDLRDPPLLREMRDQQARFSQLVTSPPVDVLATAGLGSLPPLMQAQLAEYEAALDARAERVADTAPLDANTVAHALGAEDWRQLTSELEGLLRAMEALAAALAFANSSVGSPLSERFLYLIGMFMALSEFTLWLVKRPRRN